MGVTSSESREEGDLEEETKRNATCQNEFLVVEVAIIHSPHKEEPQEYTHYSSSDRDFRPFSWSPFHLKGRRVSFSALVLFPSFPTATTSRKNTHASHNDPKPKPHTLLLPSFYSFFTSPPYKQVKAFNLLPIHSSSTSTLSPSLQSPAISSKSVFLGR